MTKAFLIVSVACNVWFLFLLFYDRIMDMKLIRFFRHIAGLWRSLDSTVAMAESLLSAVLLELVSVPLVRFSAINAPDSPATTTTPQSKPTTFLFTWHSHPFLQQPMAYRFLLRINTTIPITATQIGITHTTMVLITET